MIKDGVVQLEFVMADPGLIGGVVRQYHRAFVDAGGRLMVLELTLDLFTSRDVVK